MQARLLVLTQSLYVGIPDLQGTGSGPRAHLERDYEPAGGANSSKPHSVILNFLLGSWSDSYLSKSLAAQGPKKNLLKNILLIVAPWEALPEV
jgi:hypothetical protein